MFEKLGDLINKKISEEENTSQNINAAETNHEVNKTLGEKVSAAFLFNQIKTDEKQGVGEVVKIYKEDVPVKIAEKSE